jgi:peptidoglycan/LPS O-acetylase OafA/YrhL
MSASSATATLDPVSRSSAVEYRPAIDGLRAVAVLGVFLFHLDRRWLPGGFVGVDIFFVISGYLITAIVLRDCERNRFTFGRFYQRRIARLLAAFFTVGLATLLGAYWIYSDQDLASAGASLSAAAGSIANLKLMLQGNYFTLSPDAQPFLHCWSLSVEEQFYMLFPAIFLLIYRRANRYRLQILGVLCGGSLLACVILTRVHPTWAFFLLPTRAWELLAGSMLATVSRPTISLATLTKLPGTYKTLFAWLPFIGLALLAGSFCFITDSPRFPGYLAIAPVLGTACFLVPSDTSNSVVERLLSWKPLVLIGTMSYSLYLWHWPIFSFVDYRLYTASPMTRVALKVLLSFAATSLCFLLVEKPSRRFLNQPARRRLAFACAAGAIIILVPLGLATRAHYYINASPSDVRTGGLFFNQSATGGSMVLMGDSNASMYGKVAKELAGELNYRLNVISVAAGDPLPHTFGPSSELWRDSLAFVRRTRPDVLLFVCYWSGQLLEDKTRLYPAIQELKPLAHHIILITQPPELPDPATREGIREGSRPPYPEDPISMKVRPHYNGTVKSFEGGNVTVIDIESLFSLGGGAVRPTDEQGRELFQDGDHLSASGAELVRPYLRHAIVDRPAGR